MTLESDLPKIEDDLKKGKYGAFGRIFESKNPADITPEDISKIACFLNEHVPQKKETHSWPL